MDPRVTKQHSTGFQLVELIIVLAIASLIALAIGRAYLASLKLQSSQTGEMRINESARVAFDLLSRAVQRAGLSSSWDPVAPVPRFCSTSATGGGVVGLNNPTVAIDPGHANFTAGTTSYAIANNSDVLRVRYFGGTTTQTAAILDCHGYTVPQGGAAPTEDNFFVMVDTATNEPTLYCQTSNPHPMGTPQVMPMVTGVESMHILYGIDRNDDGLIDQYIPWNMIGTFADSIYAVKISLVVRGSEQTTTESAAPVFNHFGNTAYPAATRTSNADTAASFTVPVADRRARILAETEAGIRNMNYCK